MSIEQVEQKQIIVSGSIAMDRIKVFGRSLLEFLGNTIGPEHPQFSVSLLVDSLDHYYGGNGANISYALSRHGVRPVLLGSIGKNDKAYLRYLNKQKIDTTHVHQSQLGTAQFEVVTDKDNNQFGTFYPGAMSDSASLTLLLWKDQAAFAIISVHDPQTMLAQVRECIQLKIPYCFDIGQQVNNSGSELLNEGIEGTQFLIANAHEMSVIAKRLGVSSEVLKLRIPYYITTYGKEGAVIEGNSVPEPIKIPAASVKEVVDTTGAGDAWRGGFFAGLNRGESLWDAGLRAAVTAAYCVEVNGGQGYRFTTRQLELRLRKFKAKLPAAS